ncbi:hypothetical protein SDC9_122739 [bioreactor metagenome]|uniref:Uncharacterized protein n=1 Tax=bioreactor metagenome TaxID=1076179 RepID=A0A645CFS8_9ZZZZ
MLKVVADFVAKWLAGQIMMAIFGKAMQAKEVAAATITGAAVAAAWAPAAAMVSLATMGGNAAPASAGIGATVAVAYAFAIPGLADGGSVSGSGTSTSDSILTRLSDGEYVIQASSVSKFGIGFFNALNSGVMPAMATGGIVTGPSLAAVSSRYANASISFDKKMFEKMGLASGNQSAVVNQYNYGDINTEVDYDQMQEDLGRLVSTALMGV